MRVFAPAAVAFALVLAAAAAPAAAHEVRPAALEIIETAGAKTGGSVLVEVHFRQPAKGARVLPLRPRLPSHCNLGEELNGGGTIRAGVFSRRWRARCAGGLAPQKAAAGEGAAQISVAGLRATLTDAALTLRFADGRVQHALLRPEAPAFALPAQGAAAAGGAAGALKMYFRLGVEHLLLGFDHLLFLMCLLFFARRFGALARMVTAFTAAHSITLALAATGWLRVPQAPVEAAIAFSIVLLAAERLRRLGAGPEDFARPWALALGFGLLHGFGFAGALVQIGLPRDFLLGALFAFNLGIEAGQLLFVAAALIALRAARLLRVNWPVWLARAALYLIGALGAYWLWQRAAGILMPAG